MMTERLSAGFIRLVDAAPLIVAREMGFAEEEGIDLVLARVPSWSMLRDLLVVGRIEAAHMLAPVPVAMAMGLGGMAAKLDALMVLGVNGNVIGVSQDLAGALEASGFRTDFADAAAAGRALIALGRPLRIGVPFPFSMHAELLYYWLGALGLQAPQALTIRTVPPPLMADAIAAGEIDAFCVGEPWGSIAVETAVGELLLPSAAIRRFAPEKVLATRGGWAEENAELAGRLMRAVWRAGRWLGNAGKGTTAAELLARPEYLDLPAEVIDRALRGELVISPRGEVRKVPQFLEFFAGAAAFPWRSQGAWIGTQIAARMGLDRAEAAAAGRAVFRTDLYRQHLREAGAELPGASEKVEGAIARPTPAASESGRLFLAEDRFFDGRIFDPSAQD
jgi:ABC-type nitrate/sulfonate/bicarbonate transport system substrate-binding protein